MTEMFIFIALVVLIFVALEVTHRRHSRSWRPGLDTRRDRDLDRVEDELRTISQREPDAGAPTAPVHRAAPRSATTDYRLVNRIAA